MEFRGKLKGKLRGKIITRLGILTLLTACAPGAQTTDTTNTTETTTAPSQSLSANGAAGTTPEVAKSTSFQPVNLITSESGISVPAGFGVQVLHEGVGSARHIAVRDNGDIYVRLRSPRNGGCNVGLRDANQDGQPEEVVYFGDRECGTGMAIREPYLYTSTRQQVLRTRLSEGLTPTAVPEVLVNNLGTPSSHSARSLTLDNNDHIYVNVGAPSNACQTRDRRQGSPGQDPCPLLEDFGGIYQFSASALNQEKRSDLRYATGIRNAVALDWHPDQNKLYAVQHGRDQLSSLYPELYDAKANAENPAEELFEIERGDDFGWPYCYYNPARGQKILAPEYGGDAQSVGRCNTKKDPLMAFPAHYAPNDLLFYRGQRFPEVYKKGAWIAFHGSWNRAPLPQEGYQVVFANFEDKSWQVFADGFEAQGLRPMGLAETPAGDLLVIDSTRGKIWRIYPENATS